MASKQIKLKLDIFTIQFTAHTVGNVLSFLSTIPELQHTVHVSNRAKVSLCLQLNTVWFHMVLHFCGFLLTILNTSGAMLKCGNQDMRSHRDISSIVWSSSLGVESLDVIVVFIRRMQRDGNPCFNREQMLSNKMPLGL
jgi:hypothetical protein